MVETIIFAMIAAFLGLRLYAVLGKRTGQEHPLGGASEAPLVTKPIAIPRDEVTDHTSAPVEDMVPYDEATALGLRAIAKADGTFSAAEFVGGSKGAYAMILEGFWRGEIEDIKPLMNAEVAEAFETAIVARKAAKETLDNRLVNINRSTIKSAVLDGQIARIAVHFDADIAAVTRNGDGQVIAGSTNDAVATHDVWTFERNVRSGSPDWLLVDTDEDE